METIVVTRRIVDVRVIVSKGGIHSKTCSRFYIQKNNFLNCTFLFPLTKKLKEKKNSIILCINCI